LSIRINAAQPLNLAPQLLPYNRISRKREASRGASVRQRKGPEKRLNLQQSAPMRTLKKAAETNVAARALKPPAEIFQARMVPFYLTR
jgi:hypothetical protein